MAVPKGRTSKSRRDKRRTHQKVGAPNVIACPQCGEPKLAHHACSSCGNYKGRTAVAVEEG